MLQWVLTFHVVCLAWIFFRADSVGTAFEVLGGILSGSQPSELSSPPLLLATVGLMLASQFVPPPSVEGAQARFTDARTRAPGAGPRRRPHR